MVKGGKQDKSYTVYEGWGNPKVIFVFLRKFEIWVCEGYEPAYLRRYEGLQTCTESVLIFYCQCSVIFGNDVRIFCEEPFAKVSIGTPLSS